MGWEENCVAASFRGVTFATLSNEIECGRRVIQHQFLFKDGVVTEDLGLGPRAIKVSAFVWGDDYLEQLDVLWDALSQKGPGELVLPRQGTIRRAICVGKWKVSESAEKGGKAELALEFVEETDPPQPKNAEDSIGACADSLQALGDAAKDASLGDLIQSVKTGVTAVAQVAKFGGQVISLARGLVSGRLLTDLPGALASMTGLENQANDLFDLGLPVPGDLIGTLHQVWDTGSALLAVPGQAIAAIDGVMGQLGAMADDAMAALTPVTALFGRDGNHPPPCLDRPQANALAPPPRIAPALAPIAQGIAWGTLALAGHGEQVLLAAWARVEVQRASDPNAEIVSRDTLLARRAAFVARADKVIQRAARRDQGAVAEAAIEVQRTTLALIDAEIAASGAKLAQITWPRPIPLCVAAFRQYGLDYVQAGREAEIANLNNLPSLLRTPAGPMTIRVG